MTETRIAAIDVGNDSLKAIFGKLEAELNIPNVIAQDIEDRPVIGIEELDKQEPIEGIHIRLHSPALKDNNSIYRVGNLATKSGNSTELTQEATNLKKIKPCHVICGTGIRCGKEENKDIFKRNNNVIEATYTLGTGLPLREVKEGKDVGYRSQLLGSVHQVEFLVTPKYQGIKSEYQI